MTANLVSIIVPCFQQGAYLNDALKSILNQSYTTWECLIIDDGSTDKTAVIAREFCAIDKRFKYLYKDNKGVSEARNFGLETASGDFIQFLDADDLLQQEKIEKQVTFLNKNSQIDIIYGTSRYFFDGKQDLYSVHCTGLSPVVEMHYSDKNQLATITTVNVSTICATLYRKEVFNKVPKFKDLPFEDFFFHIECAFQNFCFHFERFEDSNCLIRMTKESQMKKHILLNEKSKSFNTALNQLMIKNNFVSPFLNELKIEPAVSLLKTIGRNITPPIILKLVKRYFFKTAIS